MNNSTRLRLNGIIGAIKLIQDGKTLTPAEIQETLLDLNHLEQEIESLEEENTDLQDKIGSIPMADSISPEYSSFNLLVNKAKFYPQILNDKELVLNALIVAADFETELYNDQRSAPCALE